MDNIDYANTIFTAKRMVPEPGDEVTTQWGRRLALNLANGFGLVINTKVEKNLITRIPIDFSNLYNFSPRVTIYYAEIINGAIILPWFSIREGGTAHTKEIVYCFNGNILFIAAGYFAQNRDWAIYCRINGV